jgi:hypothetical protein
MNDQVISYIAYGLALLVGLICFLLVKHTADEFDRWYDQPESPLRHLRAVRVPAVIGLLAVAALLVLVAR